MTFPQRIITIGSLTERDLAVLGQGFRRFYQLDESNDFGDLLARIDAAEQDCRLRMK